MSPKRIHHINFVVRDLDAAIKRFESELGFPEFQTVDHGPRGSHIARSRIGDTWFVLVCPYDPASVPGLHLAEHGEGFFLMSLGVPDLDRQLMSLPPDRRGRRRDGILDWQIADIGSWYGAELQLTQDQ